MSWKTALIPAWLRGVGVAIRRSAVEAVARRQILARYDAAQTTPGNQNHWAEADALSANAANSRSVRCTLRNRARYEAANNTYASGITQTIANDAIGTGPRLQFFSESEEDDHRVEELFAEWMKATRLVTKLRTMAVAQLVDGEAFGVLTTNPRLPTDVKLDLRLVEADQVTDPSDVFGLEAVDGIRFDAFGNPESYTILRQHPGEMRGYAGNLADTVAASQVLHFFRSVRPGQARGIPELTPALPLFAQLRRYTLATISAAETAANIAAVLYTESPSAQPPVPFEEVAMVRNAFMTLPAGAKLSQVKAEQPVTGYKEFKAQILAEIGRCLDMPYLVAACDASGHNYSSARFDDQRYRRATDVRRSDVVDVILDPIFRAWLREAVLIEGYLPQHYRTTKQVPHRWFFDGHPHVDPEKEAKAQEIRLRIGLTTLAEECASENRDWRDVTRQRAREAEMAAELGIPAPGGTGAPSAPASSDSDPDEDREVDDPVVDEEGNEEEREPKRSASKPPASKKSGEKSPASTTDAMALRARIDAIGVAVRGGIVTPSAEVEEATRGELGLPAMGNAVRDAWTKEPVRSPVTLAKSEQPAPAGGSPEDREASE